MPNPFGSLPPKKKKKRGQAGQQEAAVQGSINLKATDRYLEPLFAVPLDGNYTVIILGAR